MTDLDQNALDAALRQVNSIEGTVASKPAVALLIQRAITAYLAKRREQGYVLIYNPSVAAYDAVMERAEADTARSVSEIVTAAIEEEREACARIADARVQSTWRDRDNLVLDDLAAIIGCAHAAVAASEIAAAIRSRSSQGEK